MKTFLKSIWQRILALDNQPLNDEIRKLQHQVEELQSQELEYKKDILSKEALLKSYSLLIEERDNQIKSLDPRTDEEKQLEEFWNNKYKTGIITYNGRYTPSGVQIPVPINLMVTPNDPVIKQDLIAWGLHKTGEDPETLAPKVYRKYFDKYYKYRFDKDSWGKAEMWEYFYEMRENSRLKKEEKLPYDCDSHAQALAGYLIEAGVPRWMVRAVVGNTSIGAHSTLHVYSMVDYAWHHLNSTYGNTIHTKVSKYPTNRDAKNPTTNTGNDIIGIYHIWFSFNDLNMWYDKVEDIPKDLQLVR